MARATFMPIEYWMVLCGAVADRASAVHDTSLKLGDHGVRLKVDGGHVHEEGHVGRRRLQVVAVGLRRDGQLRLAPVRHRREDVERPHVAAPRVAEDVTHILHVRLGGRVTEGVEGAHEVRGGGGRVLLDEGRRRGRLERLEQ